MLLRLAIHASFYPTLWFGRAMCATGVWHRWDWVDANLLLGAVPSRRDLRRLHGLGIGAVVNLCEEFAGHLAALSAFDMVQLHLPTLDYHAPSTDDLLRGVRFIRKQIASQRKVYVHCKAGRGRGATLALCYLMADRRVSAVEARRMVQAARPHITVDLDRRPELRAVERMILDGTLPSS